MEDCDLIFFNKEKRRIPRKSIIIEPFKPYSTLIKIPLDSTNSHLRPSSTPQENNSTLPLLADLLK